MAQEVGKPGRQFEVVEQIVNQAVDSTSFLQKTGWLPIKQVSNVIHYVLK